jgi:hypothetical protein
VTKLHPVRKATEADLRTAAAKMIGGCLSAVTYHYLPHADGPGFVGGRRGVDADVTAVRLEFADRDSWIVTWAMQGELEGLAILHDGAPYAGLADARVDASKRDAWRTHIGERLTAIRASWHATTDDPTRESLWALRLEFSTIPLVIALGTTDTPISYVPDELVVIFDPAVGDAYRPKHVGDSAWHGRPLV